MKKSSTITIRVNPEMAQGLKLRALFDNISVGELCRTLIKKGLENEKNNEHKSKDRQKDF